MRLSTHRPTAHGLTRLEVIVILATLSGLGFVIFSMLSAASDMAKGTNCSQNLSRIGLGFRIFATDHEGRLPMVVSTNEGGTFEWGTEPNQLWRHFKAGAGDQFLGPGILWCPTDRRKRKAEAWNPTPANQGEAVFSGNQQVSYFLALNSFLPPEADSKGYRRQDQRFDDGAALPDSVLAGDRHLTVDGARLSQGGFALTGNQWVGFNGKELHRRFGSILFADGSVWQGISNRVAGAANATNLLLIP